LLVLVHSKRFQTIDKINKEIDSKLCQHGKYIHSKLVVVLEFFGPSVSNYTMRSSKVARIDLSLWSIILAIYLGSNRDSIELWKPAILTGQEPTYQPKGAQGTLSTSVVVADRRMGNPIPDKLLD